MYFLSRRGNISSQFVKRKQKVILTFILAKGEEACFEVLNQLYKKARTVYIKEYDMKPWV